jgi:hypothetical protein
MVVTTLDVRLERILAGMPSGSVPAVMTECYRLYESEVQPGRSCNRERDLRDLQRMGHAVSKMFVIRSYEHLALAGKASPSFGVLDTVQVTFKAGTKLVGLFGFSAVSGTPGASRTFCKAPLFHLFAFFAIQHRASSPMHEGVAVFVGEPHPTFLDAAGTNSVLHNL